ncbi:hypothetical protein VNO77_36913 [Canavalia gladiata]|uniref:Cell wall protein n=1 Tax=Canavalia gladiata TaxID=3824 RepID=A0AAN9KA01_CANGL
MAYRVSSFLALVLISNILLVTTLQAVVGRSIAKSSNNQDKKEPQWLFKSDGRVYIPGIGRVGFPPQNPFFGHNGGEGTGSESGSGSGSESGGHSYVPGGDDTFVPNPGFEVPIPGSGGRVPAPLHP